MLAESRLTRFFLIDMEEAGRVALYVPDEADNILFTDPAHRPAMLQVSLAIGAIRSYVTQRLATLLLPCPIFGPTLALSATVPVQDQGDLVEALRLSTPLVLRTTAVRPNIGFAVVATARGYKAKAAHLVALIDAVQSGGCIIVYALQRGLAKKLAKALRECLQGGRAVFLAHAKLTQAEKEAALNGFRDAAGAVLVCTNSAIRGVDHPNVTDIFKFRLPLWIGDDLQLDGRGTRDPRVTARSTLLYNRSMLAASFYVIRNSPEAIARFTDVIAAANNLALCHRSLLAAMLGEVALARPASSSTSCCAPCARVAAVARGECAALLSVPISQVGALIAMCAQRAAANEPATFVQLTRDKEPLAKAWAPSLSESVRECVVAQLMADRTLQLVPADPSKKSGAGLHLRVDHARLQERKMARADWRVFTLLPEEHVGREDAGDNMDWLLSS
ncbi:P-loop containing nucleoside triphosphate hydrolase protein [Pelagophyceae sp. CCMP2097]|nr:P-loop containing nucleoside triphosphate hydrolase protein [Pelagophyceae sp. CCMP2097]